MQIFLNDLKQQMIISPEDIITLKHDLLKQHPDYSNLQRTQQYFKILHAILDEALYPFEGVILKKIKYFLLRQTTGKEVFSINAFDVVSAYFKLDLDTRFNISDLENWLQSFRLRSMSYEESAALSESANPYATQTGLKGAVSEDTGRLNLHLSIPSLLKQNKWLICISSCLVITAASCFSLNHQRALGLKHTFETSAQYPVSLPISLDLNKSANYLQPDLQYKEINETALKAWLEKRHSLLISEPYFSTLMDTARLYNINPLLLFSITGQEQGFVPSSHPYALQIANNPFNLYGSWEDYNTNIKESAKIAARTIIRLGKGCPEGEDQIKWINQSYAADPNWHNGVSYFLNELEMATQLIP